MTFDEYKEECKGNFTQEELTHLQELGLREHEKEVTRDFLKDINYGTPQAISQKLKSTAFCIAVTNLLDLEGGYYIAQRYVDATRSK